MDRSIAEPPPRRMGRPLSGLVLVGLLAVLIQAVYLVADTTPLHWDPSNHVMHSMRVADGLASGGLRFLARTWWLEYVYYPPAFYLANAPAFWLFGRDLDAGIVWQMLYLLLTLFVIYRLTAPVAGGGWGVFAAACYLCFPIVLGKGRMVYIENLLALEVALLLVLCLHHRPFHRRGAALAVGLLVGVGQMTKWDFVLFAAPPLLLAVAFEANELRRTQTTPSDGLRLCISILVTAVGAFLVCGGWYIANFGQLLDRAQFVGYASAVSHHSIGSLRSLLYYPQALPEQLMGLPLSLVLAVSLVCVLLAKPRRPHLMLGGSFLLTLLLFSLITRKEGRYIMPILPVAAAILAVGLSRMKPVSRRAALVVVCLFSALNAAAQTVDLSGWLPELRLPIGWNRMGYVVRYGTPEYIMPPIRRDNWALDAIFRRIRIESEAEDVEATVAWRLKDNHRYYNANTLFAYVYAHAEKARQHRSANFWICRLDPESFYHDGEVDAQRQVFEVGSWRLPDDSAVKLYRARSHTPPLALPFTLRHSDADGYFPGFHEAETAFRWSDGTHAAIAFELKETAAPAGRWQLVLLASGLGEQPASVALNDAPVGNVVFGPDTAAELFEFDGDLLRLHEKNIVSLDLPRARTPHRGDHRVLGIALQELRLEPVATTEPGP